MSTTMDMLGDDLLQTILSKLPAKHFAFAACVSPSWNSICLRVLSIPKLSSAVSLNPSLQGAMKEVVDKVLSGPIRPHFAILCIAPSFDLQLAHNYIIDTLGSRTAIVSYKSSGIMGKNALTNEFIEIQWEIDDECQIVAAVAGGQLLKLPFTTIFEYLQMLQSIAMSMRDLGSHAVFYLAAAVSDFYVPWESMAEHKIQSASGPLDMRLVQVPKMLSALKKEWAPMAFCISFKLETDSNILLEKAEMAREKYRMHMVVANELSTRKEEVTVVTGNERILVCRDKTRADSDVEEPLIELIVSRHSAYVKDSDL